MQNKFTAVHLYRRICLVLIPHTELVSAALKRSGNNEQNNGKYNLRWKGK